MGSRGGYISGDDGKVRTFQRHQTEHASFPAGGLRLAVVLSCYLFCWFFVFRPSKLMPIDSMVYTRTTHKHHVFATRCPKSKPVYSYANMLYARDIVFLVVVCCGAPRRFFCHRSVGKRQRQAKAALFSVPAILRVVVASAAWMLKSNGSPRLCCKRYDTCLVYKTFHGILCCAGELLFRLFCQPANDPVRFASSRGGVLAFDGRGRLVVYCIWAAEGATQALYTCIYGDI